MRQRCKLFREFVLTHCKSWASSSRKSSSSGSESFLGNSSTSYGYIKGCLSYSLSRVEMLRVLKMNFDLGQKCVSKIVCPCLDVGSVFHAELRWSLFQLFTKGRLISIIELIKSLKLFQDIGFNINVIFIKLDTHAYKKCKEIFEIASVLLFSDISGYGLGRIIIASSCLHKEEWISSHYCYICSVHGTFDAFNVICLLILSRVGKVLGD